MIAAEARLAWSVTCVCGLVFEVADERFVAGLADVLHMAEVDAARALVIAHGWRASVDHVKHWCPECAAAGGANGSPR